MKRPQLALTRPLLEWLRADPSWPRLDWRLRALLAWRARWGSINQGLSAAQPVNGAPLQPLFVLGPWRSGSTVMHELLAAALGWPTPLTWQCMDATTFRLQRAPRAGVTVARPMDGLALGPLSPQEDEFALLSLGVDSVYRGFWMPHRLDELGQGLDPAFWLADEHWLDAWEGFVRGLLPTSGSGELLLKSPNHSFRAQAFWRRYPQARAVWMLRDPVEVFHSNRKMWRQMIGAHGLTAEPSQALDRFLAQALRRCAEALEWALDTLPPAQLACCEQGRLLAQPAAEIERILARLGLEHHFRDEAVRDAVQRTRSGRVERYGEVEVPAEVQEAALRLAQVQARALEQP